MKRSGGARARREAGENHVRNSVEQLPMAKGRDQRWDQEDVEDEEVDHVDQSSRTIRQSGRNEPLNDSQILAISLYYRDIDSSL